MCTGHLRSVLFTYVPKVRNKAWSILIASIIPNATAEALAAQVTQEHFDKGLIYPPFTNIRKISAHIAAKVAAKAYDLGEFLSHVKR